jgi:hypothetical protein
MGSLWPWSYGNWIYNSNLDQGEVYNIMCESLSVTSSINKTDRHDITEILLKVALIHIKQTNIVAYIFKLLT